MLHSGAGNTCCFSPFFVCLWDLSHPKYVVSCQPADSWFSLSAKVLHCLQDTWFPVHSPYYHTYPLFLLISSCLTVTTGQQYPSQCRQGRRGEVAQSCQTLCDPMNCKWTARLLHSCVSTGTNIGVDCHFLLQDKAGMFHLGRSIWQVTELECGIDNSGWVRCSKDIFFPLFLFLLPGKNVPNSNLESPLLENSVLLGSNFLLY